MTTRKICCVIKTSPYYNSQGQEGLDFILAASAIFTELTVIFIDDGVWQLVRLQRPEMIQIKRYTAGFNALPEYDINNIYIEESSLINRGLNKSDLQSDIKVITTESIKNILATHALIYYF